MLSGLDGEYEKRGCFPHDGVSTVGTSVVLGEA